MCSRAKTMYVVANSSTDNTNFSLRTFIMLLLFVRILILCTNEFENSHRQQDSGSTPTRAHEKKKNVCSGLFHLTHQTFQPSTPPHSATTLHLPSRNLNLPRDLNSTPPETTCQATKKSTRPARESTAMTTKGTASPATASM